MSRRPASAPQNQATQPRKSPVFTANTLSRRDRLLRERGIRETLEFADDLADRIEATDPAGAALLRTFRRDAAAALIRWVPDEPRSTARDASILHPVHRGSLQ